jgi:hypothetical protein
VPGSSDLPVLSLTKLEAPIKAHFSFLEIQHIGSTSCCGCDFPNIMFQNGGWPSLEDTEVDDEQAAGDLLNREGLVGILQSTGDSTVELYGVWDGNFAEVPMAFEDISLETILKPDFRFKERGFYKVHLNDELVTPRYQM